MANRTANAIEFEPVKRRRVQMDFDGGEVSSNAGVLLVRKLDRRLGLLEAVSRALSDSRDPARVTHRMAELLRQTQPASSDRPGPSTGPI